MKTFVQKFISIFVFCSFMVPAKPVSRETARYGSLAAGVGSGVITAILTNLILNSLLSFFLFTILNHDMFENHKDFKNDGKINLFDI